MVFLAFAGGPDGVAWGTAAPPQVVLGKTAPENAAGELFRGPPAPSPVYRLPRSWRDFSTLLSKLPLLDNFLTSPEAPGLLPAVPEPPRPSAKAILADLSPVAPQPSSPIMPGHARPTPVPARPFSPEASLAPAPQLSRQAGGGAYCFPVAPPYSFGNDWGAYRHGGRLHKGIDIFAAEGTEVYAVTNGVIYKMAQWLGGGTTLLLLGHDGRLYGYLHLVGYAAGIVEGKTVRRGELIAYVGSSGVLRSPPHLHFQQYAGPRPDAAALVSPYDFLVADCQGQPSQYIAQPRAFPLLPKISPGLPVTAGNPVKVWRTKSKIKVITLNPDPRLDAIPILRGAPRR